MSKELVSIVIMQYDILFYLSMGVLINVSLLFRAAQGM